MGLLEPRGERLSDVLSYITVMDGVVRSDVNHKMVTLFSQQCGTNVSMQHDVPLSLYRVCL